MNKIIDSCPEGGDGEIQYTNPKQWETYISEIKKMAKEKGISQYKISQETGFAESTISRIFNKEREPLFGTILAISRVVGYEI